jgi:hypothetical protein
VTQVGAIKGLIALGPRTIQLVLIPNVAGYMRLLDAKLKGTIDEKIQEEGKKCWDALLVCFCCINPKFVGNFVALLGNSCTISQRH